MSYTIGPAALRVVCPWLSSKRATQIAAALGPAFHDHHITTPKRCAAAVAQMAEESAGFRTTREYASGAEYEGRTDLGNTHPGDGVRYKGRGWIQITGRGNYSAVGNALKQPFVEHPELLESDRWASEGSAWWWEQHGCNQLADSGDFVALTRRINGGTNGLASRLLYWARAKLVASRLVPRPSGPTGKVRFTKAERHTLDLLMRVRARTSNPARRAAIVGYKATLLVYRAKLRSVAKAHGGWGKADRERRYKALLKVYEGGTVRL